MNTAPKPETLNPPTLQTLSPPCSVEVVGKPRDEAGQVGLLYTGTQTETKCGVSPVEQQTPTSGRMS